VQEAQLNKTCFVISPIGEKGSDIRSRADLLYDLIIEPALEKYGFSVTRADKNVAVSSITSEIVQLVQDSGLCIIDITGHNANVMYECGRRHETAKPYIMMAQEGEKLPFDINSIRTVFYNLSDAREIRNTVKVIQQMIDKMLEGGLEPGRSGESLSSLSDTLVRIERKIDRLGTSVVSSPAAGAGGNSQEYQEILASLGLVGAFNYAMAQRDIGLMDFLIPNLEKQLPLEKLINFVLTQAAPLGSALAHRKLVDRFGTIDSYDRALQRDWIGSLVAGYNIRDSEEEGLELLGDFFEKIAATEAPSQSLSSKDKAFFLNQYQRLLHGQKRLEEALAIEKQVLALDPDDRAYNYNISLIYEELERIDEGYSSAKKLYHLMKDSEDYDDDHLFLVVRLFARKNDPQAREAYLKLQEVNPYRASMVLRDKETRKALGI
jgi:tetratricopeptide (TPR) repeat protein